ncbi:MAG: flagellar hook-length control protein FliK, partial [Symbiobacteriaceae bacterium]|nr:flagellar hook-length control protein FliK [Symbiobacteriaceae bacterium]
PIETADFRTLMTPLTGSNPNATLLGQIDQWMDALKAGNVRLTEGQVTAMEMTLHPRNLGKLQLKLEMENGELRAWFATQSQIVKQALENQMSDLKDLLAEQGLNVAKLSVQVSNGQQEAASFKESMGSGNNSGLINLVSSLPPGDGEVQTAAKLWSGLMGGRLYLRI